LKPTDDAAVFFEWLKQAPSDSLAGVSYGVFGCGHPDWVATYHAVPKSIDKLLHHAGATRLVERGIGNAAVAELFEEFDDWESKFIKSITPNRTTSDRVIEATELKALSITVDSTRRQQTLRLDNMVSATVLSNDIISGIPMEENQRDFNLKRHIEVSLPKGVTYQTGDYLAILPTNPDQTVHRALRRFNLHPDDVLTIQGRSMNLPLDTPVSAYELLSGFVELGHPATRRQMEDLLHQMPGCEGNEGIARNSSTDVYKELAAKRFSLLDILEDYPEINMEFGAFLLSLPALRVRQASLSFTILRVSDSGPRLTISIQSPHRPFRRSVGVQSPSQLSLNLIYRATATSSAPRLHIFRLEAQVLHSAQQCEIPRHSDHR
jgi:cytochrome P450/NADPH-cytochrome P450 reductase